MALTREQLDALYRRHAPAAFRRARRLLGSDADAHEVVHDLFLSLCERPAQYAANSSMSTFLYAAVTHACLNRIRNRGNRTRLLRAHLAVQAQGPAVAPGPAADQLVALRSMLERMPEPLAHVAVYYHFDDLAHEDIARILGCSRRHVGNLLVRLEEWVGRHGETACAI
jgi:RNA polymerase sigma-70 factor (ECF subfamily)